MAGNNRNTKREKFLASIPQNNIATSDMGKKSLFNFSYFSPDLGGQHLGDWQLPEGSASLLSLFEKLRHFSSEPLRYWLNARAGAGSLKVLAYYGAFPRQTNFTFPSSVPHDVNWGRFRLGNKVRLAGFTVPTDHPTKRDADGAILSDNVFYVVFLDRDHQFWPTEAD